MRVPIGEPEWPLGTVTSVAYTKAVEALAHGLDDPAERRLEIRSWGGCGPFAKEVRR